MSYIGNNPVTQSFISGTDYFNGTGAQTAFTLSRTVASVNDIQAVVNNVVQVPNDAYTISGTTITFTSAPSAGTQNVYVRYLSTTTQAITPSQNTVSWNTLDSNVQGDLGISFKNRIINGNMAIDQRNAGAAVTTASSFPVDRFICQFNTDGAFSSSRSTTAPTGFTNSLFWTTTTADASLSSLQQAVIQQNIEGFNIADLGWGTANAKTVTLSFWVRSSLTGTFGGSLKNSATNRSYPFTYTISVADTWEFETITIAGDTSGTWLTDNGTGITVSFGLGVGTDRSGTAGAWNSNNNNSATGAVSVIGTLNATFYITGVQLEVGTQATTFTTAGGSYGAELALCQRYLPAFSCANGEKLSHFGVVSSSTGWATVSFQVPTRVSPTGITSNSNWVMSSFGTGSTPAGALTFNAGSQYSITVAATGASTFVAGQIGNLQASGGTATFYGTGCEL